METNYSSKKQMSCSRKWTAFIVFVLFFFFKDKVNKTKENDADASHESAGESC